MKKGALINEATEVINSIKERIEQIESNLKNLHSKDFNSLTTIELKLKEIDTHKRITTT